MLFYHYSCFFFISERPVLEEHYVPSIGVTVKMISTHEYSNSLTIYIACIKKDLDVAFTAWAHISQIENPVSPVSLCVEDYKLHCSSCRV